jgi:hypothetical protein
VGVCSSYLAVVLPRLTPAVGLFPIRSLIIDDSKLVHSEKRISSLYMLDARDK